MQTFVRMSKLTDIVGRADYISNEKRQEHIIVERSYADWKPYQEYERSHQKTNKANNEGRELIIALPNEWQNLSEIELTYRMNMLAQKILPNKYDYQWAVHLNKKETNLHAHLIFSERSRSYGSVGTWDRDVYLMNDGKIARRKADRAVDENGNVKPPVHRKGEPKSDGKMQFTVKDTRYKSDKWLEQVKQDVIGFYEAYGISVDNQGLLHQYHEGKGSEATTIHAKNERIGLANEMLSIAQRMGMAFPERSSQRFRRMLGEITNLSSPVSFYSLSQYSVKSPKIYSVMCPRQKTVDFVCSKLKEENIPFWTEKNEYNGMITIFSSSSERDYIRSLFTDYQRITLTQSQSVSVPEATVQESPMPPKTDIENIIKLKHEYVRQCCTLHYLKSCHTSCNAQNTYFNAQNIIKNFKACSVTLINTNDEYQRTFNPFKKAKLRKELDRTVGEFESSATCLGNTLSLPVSYNVKTFEVQDMDRILARTTAPLAEMKKKADSEVRYNKKIDELRASVTDASVSNALRAFQTACDNVPERDRQEVYNALKDAITPLLPFENMEFRMSRGRITSETNVADILKQLAPSIPMVREREHTQQQQHRPIRHGR